MEQTISRITGRDYQTGSRITKSALSRLDALCDFSKRSLRRMLFGSPHAKKERFNPNLTNEYFREAFPYITDYSEDILINFGGYSAIDYGASMAIDSRGQKVRLGRALVKCAKSLNYNGFISLGSLHAAVVGGFVEVDDDNKVKIAERIAQKLGGVFSSKPGEIFITTKALDFVTAGIVAGTKSCYKPGGAHFGGCSAYAMDEQTLLVQYIREGELIGRFWVHVDFENLLVLAEPIYGTFPLAFQRQVLKYIMEKLLSFMSAFMDLDGVTCEELDPYYISLETYSIFPEEWFPGYIDFRAGKYRDCRVYGVSLDRSGNRFFELKLREGLCLECGAIRCQSDGFCKECNEPTFCSRCGCGALYEYETFFIEDEPLCYDCYRELSDARSSPK